MLVIRLLSFITTGGDHVGRRGKHYDEVSFAISDALAQAYHKRNARVDSRGLASVTHFVRHVTWPA